MGRVLQSPAALELKPGERAVFLAGSIEKGRAVAWQVEAAAALADLEGVAVLNPRRDDWDDGWAQSIEEPRFRAQVEWELSAQERADVIAMYFAPETRAPVTLLELGLAARGGKLVVCCPAGFWRKGNVEVVAARYGVEVAHDLGALVARVRRRLGAGAAGA